MSNIKLCRDCAHYKWTTDVDFCIEKRRVFDLINGYWMEEFPREASEERRDTHACGREGKNYKRKWWKFWAAK